MFCHFHERLIGILTNFILPVATKFNESLPECHCLNIEALTQTVKQGSGTEPCFTNRFLEVEPCFTKSYQKPGKNFNQTKNQTKQSVAENSLFTNVCLIHYSASTLVSLFNANTARQTIMFHANGYKIVRKVTFWCALFLTLKIQTSS